MKEVAISEFKAKCLGMLEEVRKTRKPIRVTRFGQPVAEINPPTPQPRSERWLGAMAGSAEIVGDIVGPIGSFEDWDGFRE
jgi:prevent-host-death family protein